MQRTFIIIGIVAAIVAIGAGVYFFFFAQGPGVVVAPSGVTLPIAGQTSGGTGGATTLPEAGSITASPTNVSARLVKISAGPVVPGAIIIDTKPSTASGTPDRLVQYLEQESGNVFSYSANTGVITRINNKTIPGIQTATWLPNASAALVRYLSGADFSTINTYLLAASSSSGSFLAQNLGTVAVSATKILTLASGVTGSVGSLARADGSHPTTVFATPLTSLSASFAGKSQYLIYTKPSALLDGYAFLVDSAGRFSRVAGPLPGLVALASPSGKQILVSYALQSSMHTELVNTATGEIIPLPIGTIADKCVWTADEKALYCGVPVSPSANAHYPDDWYRGTLSFSDRIWKIDTVSRYAQMILDFSQMHAAAIDVTAPAIDPAASLLVFLNKNDGSLWGYTL